mgnify:CR=1 FL=1
MRADGMKRLADVLVYFGAPVHESTGGIDDVYAALLTMEELVIAALAGNGFVARYIETITDEYRIEHFKLMAVVAEVDVREPLIYPPDLPYLSVPAGRIALSP